MKIKVTGWITPEAYQGTVLKGEVFSRPLKVDLDFEADGAELLGFIALVADRLRLKTTVVEEHSVETVATQVLRG